MTKPLDCAHARHFVRPEAGPLHPALQAQVEEHLAGCPECSGYLALEPKLLEAYESLRAQQAPEALRHKVVGAVRALQDQSNDVSRSEPARRDRWLSLEVGRAAVLLAALFAGVIWVTVRDEPSTGFEESAYVTDFVRRAQAGEHLATSDPAELTAFFQARLGVPLQPLQVEGLVVESGEVCILDGELGALILYKLDGRVLSHYLVPRRGTTARSPSQRVLAPDETLGMHNAADVSMVTWASDAIEQALVGPAPAEALATLVAAGADG
ncbi:MAG: zf-HC2 domain-containing protein [Gemmatimonadota bacterium]|nr:zf-HC2 domain-containing protein [Gemmatimonadota bacterium]